MGLLAKKIVKFRLIYFSSNVLLVMELASGELGLEPVEQLVRCVLDGSCERFQRTQSFGNASLSLSTSVCSRMHDPDRSPSISRDAISDDHDTRLHVYSDELSEREQIAYKHNGIAISDAKHPAYLDVLRKWLFRCICLPRNAQSVNTKSASIINTKHSPHVSFTYHLVLVHVSFRSFLEVSFFV